MTKVYLCYTGHEEGSTIHHIYLSKSKAEQWEIEMKEVMKNKSILNKAWSEAFEKDGNTEEEAWKAFKSFCDQHGINTVDKYISVDERELEE